MSIKEGLQKIEDGVVEGYKKIEDGVVGGYKKIEQGAVDGFNKVTDKCVEKLFAKEGETVEDFNEEEALKEAGEKAVKALRDIYIREALVKAENVNCTWEEVQQQAAYYAYQNGIPKESFDKVMKNQNFLASIQENILVSKAIMSAVKAIIG